MDPNVSDLLCRGLNTSAHLADEERANRATPRAEVSARPRAESGWRWRGSWSHQPL